jgi:hypothetical protein
MRLVRQRDRDDCGVACVAMAAGATYEEAEAAMLAIGRKAPLYGRDALAVLSRLRMVAASCPVPHKTRVGTPLIEKSCLVGFIHPKTGKGHWIARDGRTAYDPAYATSRPVASYRHRNQPIACLIVVEPR